MAKLHISFPISVGQSQVGKLAQTLRGYGHEVTFCNRGAYSDEWLRQADAVVFILPDNKWDVKISSLPTGMFTEYVKASNLKKDLFTVYRKASGEVGVYKCSEEAFYASGYLSGQAGTSEVIKTYKKSTTLSHLPTTDIGRKCDFGVPETPVLSNTILLRKRR